MKKMKFVISAIFCLIALTPLSAHDHEPHHERNEVGLSGGAIYTINDKVWGGGAHLHYFRTFTPDSKLAWGASFEKAWADGNHLNLSAGIKYELFERIEIGIMPGITFIQHHDEHSSNGQEEHGYETRFSGHIEVVYNIIEVGKFHLGPAIDYSWTKGDSHFMLGAHIAYCF